MYITIFYHMFISISRTLPLVLFLFRMASPWASCGVKEEISSNWRRPMDHPIIDAVDQSSWFFWNFYCFTMFLMSNTGVEGGFFVGKDHCHDNFINPFYKFLYVKLWACSLFCWERSLTWQFHQSIWKKKTLLFSSPRLVDSSIRRFVDGSS